jgi:hypothetical protein
MLEDRERLAREAVRRAKKNVSWLFTKEGSRRFFRSHMEAEGVEMLVALARGGDKDAVEILRKHARGARAASMGVPIDLHEFVWEWFIDGPPKAKSGSNLKDTGLRHLSIALLVKKMIDYYGFPEYGNSEHRGNPDGHMSACRLVAEELGLSARTVEDIWSYYKAMVTRPRRPPA